MKEAKKATPKKTTARKTTTKNTNTKSAQKPKVKDVVIEENFLDEEETDKRLVVFAVIAILVILATIVTLVIGCDRKKEKDPVKPNDDIVVPDKKDDKEDEGVDTPEIVRKVTSVYRGKKTKESNKKKTDTVVEDTVYTVTYYMGDTSYDREIKEGEKIEEFVPDGYSSCKYYKEEPITDESEEYDMTQVVTDDTHIYMTCTLITYNVVYDKETANPTTFTVEDNGGAGVALDKESYEGWFKEETYENEVTTLDKSLVADAKEVDGEYYIYLFAKEVPCEGEACDVNPETPGATTGSVIDAVLDEEELEEEEEETLPPEMEQTEPEILINEEEEENEEEENLPPQTEPVEIEEEQPKEPEEESREVEEPEAEPETVPETVEPAEVEPPVVIKEEPVEPAHVESTPVVHEEPAVVPKPVVPETPKHIENENKTEDNSGEEKPEEGIGE